MLAPRGEGTFVRNNLKRTVFPKASNTVLIFNKNQIMTQTYEPGPRASYHTNYINEDHINIFKEALNYDDYTAPVDGHICRSDSIANSISNSIAPPKPSCIGVETITSQSDWTPVYNKTRKRYPSELKSQLLDQFTEEKASERPVSSSASSAYTYNHINNFDDTSFTFTILRYPLLTFIICWTTTLSILYFFVRLSISLSENYLISRDKKRSELVNNLRNSSNYAEYIENSRKLDTYLGLDEWCNADRYKYYDWRNIRRTINNLKRLRHANKYEDLMVVLQTCLKSNFAGTENPLLYSHCYYGTKKLIEKYNTEVVNCLNVIINAKGIDSKEKRIFFKIINKNFGRTCLVLSGGASFCYNHFGVLKALIENDCMPKIISGTSGGGMIAAMTATRTNEEILELIKPELACKINAFGDEPMWKWVKRWWNTGARFDLIEWARKAQWWTTGSTTFEESYKQFGKILNISTVPNDIHSPTILCNYITSPNCCIWSAMLASAAVPGILNPVMLMEKTKDNSIRPFSLGSKWKDGSLRTDVPLSTLNMYFNTKFSIVSQVNPHVMLWIFKNRGDIGKPVVRSRGKTFRGGFILSYFENLIKLEIIKWLKLVKEFQLFPNLLESDWSNLFLQNFSGTITLFPKIVTSDYMHILADPTEERLSKIIRNGEAVTYPKLLFIKHRLNIERTIERGLKDSKVDIDATSNAPPNLVENMIENEHEIISSYADDESISNIDDNTVRINGTKETIRDNKHLKFFIPDIKSDEGEDLVTDEADIVDDDDDIEDNLQRTGKPDLGFLGIRMGISPDNLTDESYDEAYASHEDNFDKE